MLVLSRKLGERILVPHTDLTVTVIAIDGNTVKLGINAPPDVGIYREELWRKVCAENVAPRDLSGAPAMKSGDGVNYTSGGHI
jgi:carbon storage regulator